MELKDKSVLITGSAGGLGKAMADHFAAKGANIILSDIQQDKLDAAVQDLKSKGTKVVGIQADVSKESDAEKLMQEGADAFGSLDVAVLNAGILRDGLMVKVDRETGKVKSKMSLEQWQSVINVNLTGVFLTAREAATQMINRKTKGVIIPISSIARHGNLGQSNYSAAKAGVASLTTVWSKELSRFGIRVAGIAPGFIATEMVMKDMNAEALKKWEAQIPVGRLGKPEEIAKTAEFIVENDLVTGVILEISGGVRI